MKFQIGAMTVGDILDRGLKMLLANLPAFYLIHLMVLWPIIIFQFVLPTVTPPDSFASLMIGGFIPLILLVVLQPIATAAILHIISQDFVDRRVSIGSAIGFAMRRFGTLLGTAILTGLVLLAGFVMCFVPMIFFLVWFAFYAQIVVVENLGGARALTRSMALTKGFRWRVLGVLVLIILIGYAIQIPFALLGLVLPSYDQVPVPKRNPMDPFELGFRLIPIYPNLWINLIVAWLVSILAQAYAAICVTLLYFDLRNRKEGFDLEMAASVHEPAEQP